MIDYETMIKNFTRDSLEQQGVTDINEMILESAVNYCLGEHNDFIVKSAVAEYYLVMGDLEKGLKAYEQYKKAIKEWVK